MCPNRTHRKKGKVGEGNFPLPEEPGQTGDKVAPAVGGGKLPRPAEKGEIGVSESDAPTETRDKLAEEEPK